MSVLDASIVIALLDARDAHHDTAWRLLDDAIAAGLEQVLVVGHKGVNRVIVAQLMGLELDQLFTLEQECCAVTLLRVTRDAEGNRRVRVAESAS